jgi:hypothetical protein
MPQQKGVKRAAKVAIRKKKLNAQAKIARARKAIRDAEVAEKDASNKE